MNFHSISPKLIDRFSNWKIRFFVRLHQVREAFSLYFKFYPGSMIAQRVLCPDSFKNHLKTVDYRRRSATYMERG